MLIRTFLRHGSQVFRDCIYISELELAQVKTAQLRADLIRTARQLSMARCLNAWRAQIKQQQP